MFSGSFLEKAVFQPFVFKMFSASDNCAMGRHMVTVQSEGVRLETYGIINPFLLRVPGNEATDRTRSSEGVLPVTITARASAE